LINVTTALLLANLDRGGLIPSLSLTKGACKKNPTILDRSMVYSLLSVSNLGSLIANMNSKIAKIKLCEKLNTHAFSLGINAFPPG